MTQTLRPGLAALFAKVRAESGVVLDQQLTTYRQQLMEAFPGGDTKMLDTAFDLTLASVRAPARRRIAVIRRGS